MNCRIDKISFHGFCDKSCFFFFASDAYSDFAFMIEIATLAAVHCPPYSVFYIRAPVRSVRNQITEEGHPRYFRANIRTGTVNYWHCSALQTCPSDCKIDLRRPRIRASTCASNSGGAEAGSRCIGPPRILDKKTPCNADTPSDGGKSR